ncbi:type II toxin-antitoxin system PemK/MazF family toxin [Paeniglutamicibacter sp. NPDC012692]|uniref:type II toxin-antitoxin system PemK/MazF family toxin n=1 Tax=Paeniglutamicibacter sp. NPDC012692 TaxID=3364388 RepID=UPI0036CE7F52
MKFNANKFFGFLGRVLEGFLKSQNDTSAKEGTKRAPTPPRTTTTATKQGTRPRPAAPTGARNASKSARTDSTSALGWENGDYPGDFHGAVKPRYNPETDGQPDPGEIVWAWVPYEEDYSQGKDRPVLLIGNDGKYLLALMLTSKDHTNPQRSDRDYVDVGSGPWDKQGRPSEVKVDRLIRLLPSGIRREGAVLNKQLFSRVADRLSS